MKKIFAMTLAAVMLLCCMVVVPSAASGRVMITACDTLAGWSNNSNENDGLSAPELNVELDPDGYGVVSYTYTGDLYPNGGWSHPDGNGKTPTNGIKIAYKVADDTEIGMTEYDLTGMNYFIFDIYVSNAAALQNVKFYLELTSAGAPDKEETGFHMTLGQMKGGELVDGWNHIELALASSNSKLGETDWAAWDFMRIYNGEAVSAGDGLTLAFKNLYFSEVSEAAEAAKAAAEAITSKYALIADIVAGDVTADNYETVKAQLAAAIDAYNAADAAAQTAAAEVYDIAKIERTVTRAIEKYEDELAAAEQEPTTPPADDEPVTPPVDDEPVTPPADDEPVTPPADDEPTTGEPADDDPVDPAPAEKDNTGTIIIAVVAIVAVAAIVIVLVLKKKK